MPGISHLLYGLMLVIPIMYIAKDRFNYKVAAIFVLNNWIGPDSYWAFRYIPLEMENLFGFAIWAIGLSLFYSYLSRFSITKTDRFFTIVDDGKRDVSWRNAYLLCLAGGICHVFIDGLFHGEPYRFALWEGWSISLTDINALGELSYGLSQALIVLAFVAMIVTSLLVIYYLRKEVKDALLFLFVMVGLVVLNNFTLGGEVFGEREISATLCMFGFVFIPLIIMAYVANHVNNNPTKPSPPLMKKDTALKLVATITLAIAVIFVLFGLTGIIAPEIPNSIIGGGLSNEMLFVIGIIVMGIAGVGVAGAVGLYIRINICRKIVIFICTLLLFFVFPFAIALFLCRDDIKEMFLKNQENKENAAI